MKKIEGFSNMLDVIQKERGIPKEMLVGAVEAALLSACRKKFKNGDNLSVKIDNDGNVTVFAKRTVTESPEDLELQISPDQAKKIDKKAKVGDEIEINVTPEDFGRLAAQTAKQVIIQRMREAEKEISFDEFSKKQGDIITGTIQQKEFNGYLVNLGRIETLLPFSEVPPTETLRIKDRVKLYVIEVNKLARGPAILISRSHPGLVKKLFELEVPEIVEGTLEIKNVVREAGRRTKISLTSNDSNVSVVGTCVGHMGGRIQNIVKELGNERIDIIEWKEDPKAYITNALSPAKIDKIELDKEAMNATVTVAESQLSLAIGKEGQNVRLASKLTGWKIDIRSETGEKISGQKQKADKEAEAKPQKKKKDKNATEEKTSPSEKDKG
ncbi:MAG: transcription termination factor NusA [Candidatus Saganbacteria bacterium]|nr:transcription termination factor NusA [Candidatus Saganbacteria bacterium]